MRSRKTLIILCSLILVVALPLTVYAYLTTRGNMVRDIFTQAQDPTPTISEDFDGTTKENVAVSVGETGYSVYVRAVIVVTWEDDQRYVHSTRPVEGTDYTIQLNTEDWFFHNGFYYHKAAVNSGEDSAVLIHSCVQKGTAPKGFQLQVEIIAQTIQSAGTTDAYDIPAVEDAWGVKVDGNTGELTAP